MHTRDTDEDYEQIRTAIIALYTPSKIELKSRASATFHRVYLPPPVELGGRRIILAAWSWATWCESFGAARLVEDMT